MMRPTARAFVWIGGAVFVAALALMVWRYSADFGRGGGAPSAPAALVDTLWLTLFACHHSLFARPRAKDLVARLVPADLVRSTYVWIASLLLIAVCVWWQPIGGTVYRLDGAARVLLVALQVAGLWLVVRAVRAIRALELAGIESPRPHRDDLQVRGPYALVRHPLYLGWILAVGGASHMTGDRLLFAGVTTLYIAVAIPWEERGLIAEFGEAYERYRRQVRWRVVPFVY